MSDLLRFGLCRVGAPHVVAIADLGPNRVCVACAAPEARICDPEPAPEPETVRVLDPGFVARLAARDRPERAR